MAVRMRYDVAVDALAIELRPGARVAHTITTAPGVNLDLDGRGHVVTIELLDASAHVPRAELEELPTAADYLTLAEAAAASGLAATTLRGRSARAAWLPSSADGTGWSTPRRCSTTWSRATPADGAPVGATAARMARSPHAPRSASGESARSRLDNAPDPGGARVASITSADTRCLRASPRPPGALSRRASQGGGCTRGDWAAAASPTASAIAAWSAAAATGRSIATVGGVRSCLC